MADIDGDRKLDIAASYTWRNVPDSGHLMAWWENPGNGSADWKKHPIGTVRHWKDRCDAADLTGNGRQDIIATEECSWGPASVYWFENPGGRATTSWKRHTLVTQYTTNSMGVADMNQDGRPDIVVAEHRGTKILSIWENMDRGGRFVEYIVSTGRENHMGCHLADLDGDGDIDIAGPAWNDYQYLYVWRNDAKFMLGDARTVVTPVIEPNGGNSTGMFTVHFTTSTAGAVIRYTVDGSEPTLVSGSIYAQPLQIAGSCTVKARAFKPGMTDRLTATAVFKTTYYYD
ncbi:MAG: FG-GAP-like repeat-containing protein [Terriglobia bacterium]